MLFIDLALTLTITKISYYVSESICNRSIIYYDL